MAAMKRQSAKPRAGKVTAATRSAGKVVLAQAARPGRKVRKNMDMDAAKLAAAKRYLGARSETETVDAALDLAVFQGEVAASIDQMVRAGGLVDAFGR